MSIMNAKQFYGKERGQKANFPNDNMEYKIRYGNNAAHGWIFVELTSKKCNKSPPLKYVCINHGGLFPFEIIINVLVTFSRYICIHISWVYGHYKYFNSSVRGPSSDVRI